MKRFGIKSKVEEYSFFFFILEWVENLFKPEHCLSFVLLWFLLVAAMVIVIIMALAGVHYNEISSSFEVK